MLVGEAKTIATLLVPTPVSFAIWLIDLFVLGALIAAASPALVFVLNALLSVLAFVLILRWRSTPRTSPLPGERFIGAMRVGLNFAWQSPRLKGVMWRSFLFFLQSAALTSLLPLVALKP